MINIFHRSREFVAKHKNHHHLFLAVLALVIAGTGAYTYRHQVASAATFYFTQSSWAGGVTANTANHTSNRTNWTEYSAKTTYINADANGISLPSTAKQITDDGRSLSSLGTIASGNTPNGGAVVSPSGTSVYIANQIVGAGTISQYSRNATTGVLTALSPATIAAGSNTQGLAISPDGAHVYATSNSDNNVRIYSRNATSGLLTFISTIATGTEPAFVAVSPDGASVYVANFSSANVSMYSRNAATGALTALSTATIAAGTQPYGIAVSNNGSSVYVGNFGSANISQFSRDTTTGALTALGTPTIAAGTSARDVVISADDAFVYSASQTSQAVHMYSRNATTGQLTALSPASIAIGGSGWGLVISRDGTSVYAVSYSTNIINIYSRSVSTGLLTSIGTISAGTSPRAMAISPDGASVYVANYSTNNVSQYSRGASGGATGFESGANSNTAVSGTGPSASVELALNTRVTTTGSNVYSRTGGYEIYKYTGSGTFQITSGTTDLEYLVVGGGGGGGSYFGGGGGAGGFRTGSLLSKTVGTNTVTVGAGGIKGANGGTGKGGSGGQSVFSTVTSAGGGGGGSDPCLYCSTGAGLVGGSGGGSFHDAAGALGTSGQGNNGGAGLSTDLSAGGGGGGAGGIGANVTATDNGGNGGAGLVSSIESLASCPAGGVAPNCYYAGGGGGGGNTSRGAGGSGGGGAGGVWAGAVAVAGTANTGGGGGGDGGGANLAGAGGSGVVVVRYPTVFSTTGTFTSAVLDTGAKSNFTTLAYTATLNGQTLTVDIRAGDSSTAPAWGSTDANWTSTGLTNVANGGSIASLGAHRYVQYRANLSTNDGSISPTLDNVIINSSQYSLGGNLTSSVYDTIDATNILAGVSWTSGGTSGTETVALQIRSSADNSTWTSWCGATSCNNTDTFTTSPSTISSGHPIRTDGIADKYIQYKVILASGGSVTPVVTQVVMTYVVNAPPLVGNIVASQVSDSASANYGKVSFSFDASDSDTTTGSSANQLKLTPTLYEYSTNGGGAWTTISSGLSANAYSVINLTGDSATTTTAVTWTPTAGIALTSTAKIRVTVTDGEAANATASGTSGAFTLDSAVPVISVANIDSSGTQDVVNLTTTDGSAIVYRLCNDVAFTGCAVWSAVSSGVATSTNWTATGAPNAETVYLQVRDLYGNLSSGTLVAPATPASFLAADISNPPANTFGETLSWLAVANATSYNVYYATSTTSVGPAGTYTLLASPASNVYAHTITTATTSAYWYKVRAVNANGDKSNYATIATGDIPDSFGTSLADTTAPVISNISAPAGSLRSASVVVTFTTDELATSTVLYGTSFLADCSYGSIKTTTSFVTAQSVTVDNLQPSTTYYYCVKATDVLSNTSLATTGGTFATVGGPTISSVTVQNLAGTSATIMWNTATSSNSYIHYSTSNSLASPTVVGSATMVAESPTPGIFQHQVGLSGLTAGTIYYFKVQSTDSDNNSVTDTNSGSYYSFTTLADTTAPAIVGTIETPVKAPTAAVIVWQTDEPATSQVNWGLASTTLTRFTVNDATKSIYHVVTLSSGTLDTTAVSQELVPETPYYFTVTSADAANNSMTSGVQTFTSPATGNVTIVVTRTSTDTTDTIPPVISNITVSDITPFSTTVKFSTDEDTVAEVEAGATQTYGQTASNFDWGKTQTIKLRGLTLGTEYHFRVKAVDRAGNTGTSADQTFKTTFLSENLKDMANVENIEQFQKEIENAIESILPSLVPPFITKPIISDITEGGAKVSFKSNIKAFPVVAYVEDGAYDETKDDPYTGEVSDTTEKSTSHELVLTGLKGNTKYHIQARGFSLPKVIGKSVDVTFITKASKIAGSIVERKKDSFTVVWTTDQPTTTIVEYKDLKRGITQRKTDDAKKTSHSMKIENLPSGTAYEVNLSGLTEQGNIAEAGSPLSVTTSTDVTPPDISGFKVDNALVPGRTDRIQTIVSWVTDEPSNSTAYYQEGAGAPGDTEELANKNEILDSYVLSHSVILPSLKPGTIYRLKVTSSDDSGNLGSFGPRTVITPKQTESITDIIFKNFEDSFKFLRKI